MRSARIALFVAAAVVAMTAMGAALRRGGPSGVAGRDRRASNAASTPEETGAAAAASSPRPRIATVDPITLATTPFVDRASAPGAEAPAVAFVATVIDGRTKAPAAGVPWTAALYDDGPWPEAGCDTSPATVARHGGRRVEGRSDAQGRFRLEGRWWSAIVYARSGRLGGRAEFLRHERYAAAVVELTEGVDVVGRTFDGKPAAGLRIRVSSARYGSVNTAVLDAEGRGFVTRPAHDVEAPTWRLWPDVTGLHSAAGAVEVGSGCVEPVRIELPPTGSLTLRAVGADGAPLVAPWTCRLFLLSGATPHHFETEEGRPVVFDRSRDGAATFRYVVPQAALRAVVDTRSTELLDGVAEFAAAAAGAELAVDVPCGEPALVVAGRVLCDDGAPLGGAAVWIAPSGGVGVRYPGHRVYGATATTTDDGTFRTGLSIPRAPLPRSYFVEARHPSVRIPRERVAVTGTVVDGVADLGTIVVKRPVILCAGVVVDAQGAPVPFADVSFFRLERLPPQIETSTYGWRADAAGRFEIAMQPDAPAGPARALGASVAGLCAFDLVPFETGARDLRIVAKPSGELIGSFRFRGLDQASPRPKWSRNVTVRVTGAAATGLPAYIGSADADGMNAVVQGGSFTAYHLREGEARVEFRLGEKGRVLLAVENVAVRGGEIVKDPRLQDVDLTAALELVAVSVVDEAGAPVPTAEVHLQDEAGEWSRFEVDTAGRVDAPFAADARDAYVLAPGFGARRLRAIPTATTVRLQRTAPITVAVRLADDTPFEIDGESVGASIHYLGPGDASDAAASAFRGHPFNEVAPSPADLSRAPFDARRLVHLEVWGPGVYEVRPILHHSRGWSTLSMPDPPKTIAVVEGASEAPVVLSVPLEVLKEARARRR